MVPAVLWLCLLIAKTLQNVQKNKSIKNQYFTAFAELPSEYEFVMDCEDYVETTDIENFFGGIFKNKNTTFEKASKKLQEKR